MADLPFNLSSYYNNPSNNPKGGNSALKNDFGETEIEVLSSDEAIPPPPPPPPSEENLPKKSPAFNKKTIIVIFILLMVIVNIFIGLRLYQMFKKKPAVTPETPVPTQQPGSVIPPTNPPFAQPTESLPLYPTLATEAATDSALIETHSECFNTACIEVEGPGKDQCLVDKDCQITVVPTQTLPTKTYPTVTNKPSVAVSTAAPTSEEIQPDIPAVGTIKNTVLGIISGLGILAFAFLL